MNRIYFGLADRILSSVLPPGSKTLLGVVIFGAATFVELLFPHVMDRETYLAVVSLAGTLGGIGVIGKVDRFMSSVANIAVQIPEIQSSKIDDKAREIAVRYLAEKDKRKKEATIRGEVQQEFPQFLQGLK